MKPILTTFLKIYNNKRLLLLSIFAASLLFSLIFLLFFKDIGPPEHQPPGTDYRLFYKPTAQSLTKGEGITIGGVLTLRVPPGYPIILSVIFALAQLIGIYKIGLVIIFNTIMVAIASIFLFLIAESIFNKKIALLASFLWMSYPFNLWFIKNPHTEVPFILFLYIGIWFCVLTLKRRQFQFAFLSGIFVSFASLIRPITLLLPFFLALLIFLLLKDNPKRTRIFLAVGLLIGSLIAVLPWEGYIFAQTGHIIPLSSGAAPTVRGGLVFAVRPGKAEVTVPSDVRALMERAQATDLSSESKVFQFCFRELINRPITFLKFVGIKIIRAWYATSQRWYEGTTLVVQLFYLIPAFFGAIYGIKIYRDRIRYIILLLSIIFFFWVMTTSVLSILRYMIPVMGLVIIFSAILIELIIARLFRNLPINDYAN